MNLRDCRLSDRVRVKRVLVPKRKSVNEDWEIAHSCLGKKGIIVGLVRDDHFPVTVRFRNGTDVYYKAGELEIA